MYFMCFELWNCLCGIECHIIEDKGVLAKLIICYHDGNKELVFLLTINNWSMLIDTSNLPGVLR